MELRPLERRIIRHYMQRIPVDEIAVRFKRSPEQIKRIMLYITYKAHENAKTAGPDDPDGLDRRIHDLIEKMRSNAEETR